MGKQRLDLFLADEVVVEIKVADELTRLHKAQTISYLKVVGKSVGLLCNLAQSLDSSARTMSLVLRYRLLKLRSASLQIGPATCCLLDGAGYGRGG